MFSWGRGADHPREEREEGDTDGEEGLHRGCC